MNRILGIALVLGLALPALAKEKRDLESKDKSQEAYSRKSMTYLGIFGEAEQKYLDKIERMVRSQLEMKRFDYNHVNVGKVFTLDQFVRAIREYVAAVKLDRAKAEGEFSERFKEINVTLEDVEKIADSAYFYQIRVPRLNFARKTARETWRFCVSPNAGAMTLNPGAKMGSKSKCAMTVISVGVTREFYEAQLTTEADFFHVDMDPEAAKGYEKIKTVSASKTNTSERPVVVSVVVKGGSIKSRDVRYTEEPAQTQQRAFNGLNFLMLAKELQKQERNIEAFKLKVAVESSDWNGVTFPLGKREGLWKDIGFLVNEFSTSGKKSKIGYVKVRDIGNNEKAPPESSWAQTITSKHGWSFEGGEQLEEYPQIGYNVVIGVGVASLMTDKAKISEKNSIFGGGPFGMGISVHLTGEWNLAEYLGISEFYQTLHLSADLFSELTFANIGLGILWKHYIHRFAFGIEVYGFYGRLAGKYDANGDGTNDVTIDFDQGDNHNGGVGGRLVLEVFLSPDWTLALRAGGRFAGSTAVGVPAYLLSGPVGHLGIVYTF